MKVRSALITGASSGIGLELARIMAAHGFSLALVARNQDRLEKLAQSLHHEHHVDVRIVPADLSTPETAGPIFQRLQEQSFPVSVLVNNAGVGVYGRFAETSLEDELTLLQVNIGALVQLTKLFLRPMLEAGEGKILNVASTAAFQPGPRMALYYASKACVYSFSVALALELEGSGVTVTTLCPGGTETEFHHRAGMEQSRLFSLFRRMPAQKVAQAGFDALMKGRRIVVAGWANRLMALAAKCSPTLLSGRVAGRLNEPRKHR